MPALTIPKSERSGLAILREMPTETFAAFLAEVERSPVPPSNIPGVSPDDTKLAFAAVSSMGQVRAYHDVPLDEFVSDVCEALIEYEQLKPTEEPQFRDRLMRLLNIESLNITAKAAVLQGEFAFTFCSARIMTDIRPVFREDVLASPPAAVITHTLKIDYHGAMGHLHELYLGIRPQDITEIRDVLDRAEKKIKSLESMLKPLDMRLIDPRAE